MFVLNAVSGGMMMVSVITLFVGLTYSSIRRGHDQEYHQIYDLKMIGPNLYRVFTESKTWLQLIPLYCEHNITHVGHHEYVFNCTNATLLNSINLCEEEYLHRTSDGRIIMGVYLAVFGAFAIGSAITARLYGYWRQHYYPRYIV